MVSTILALRTLVFGMTVSTNEDWQDAWAYVNEAAQPLSLAGITLNFVLRVTRTGALPIVASTRRLVGTLPVNGAVIRGGVAGNVCALSIPRATMLKLIPGLAYDHETQAQADGVTRTIARGAVNVLHGANP